MSDKTVVAHHDSEAHTTMGSYVIGFIASLALTFASYFVVTKSAMSHYAIVAVIIIFALTQFFIQMICFLHLGQEYKPRWKLFAFGFMVMVVLILVIGSLWIMNNLDYRMTPEEVNQYLQSQEAL